jgi:O-acetylhomoserine (thiol)-lyase
MGAEELELARQLSPRRRTSKAESIDGLVREQLEHFAIDPDSPVGRELGGVLDHVYRANVDLRRMWDSTLASLARLPQEDRIAYFNAKRFLCFQLAKLLDTLQGPLRRSYQSLVTQQSSQLLKGPYPIFDNVTALFSSTPVIARTATYLYACTEWIDDAFRGRELLLEIYSRLMNPTSTSLANHIVDIEAGPLAGEYFAWNFNSGMAAIDAILSHLVGYGDVVLASRNIYGGAYQLLHDWYGKKSNLDVAVHWFDGTTAEHFERALRAVETAERERLAGGRQIYVYLESPCNPHGYVLDVAGISRIAHRSGWNVICDTTVGTPILARVLRRSDPAERPDFVLHSYTKDIAGSGTTTAGVVIGRNERMFIPKGDSVTAPGLDGKPHQYLWSDTLFWNVYYVKGAFLDADKAFEVIQGMRTLELRMLRKCVGTIVLAQLLARHPDIQVSSSAVPGNENAPLCEAHSYLGLPAPLFTVRFADAAGSELFSREIFQRFFDRLEPAFGLQVSLGQISTVVLCPALTSHSELSADALAEAGIYPTTIRVAVGDEDPRALLAHFMHAARATLDRARPGFSARFPSPEQVDALHREVSLDVQRRYLDAQPSMASLLA